MPLPTPPPAPPAAGPAGAAKPRAAKKWATVEAAQPEPAPVAAAPPMTQAQAHGLLGKAEWALPAIARHCDEQARMGYSTKRAHEYLDTPEVLAAKLDALAGLVRKSSHMAAFAGAGLSTAAGIHDYASQADGSLSGDGAAALGAAQSAFDASHTLAHRAMAVLYQAGQLSFVLQQNHDGPSSRKKRVLELSARILNATAQCRVTLSPPERAL